MPTFEPSRDRPRTDITRPGVTRRTALAGLAAVPLALAAGTAFAAEPRTPRAARRIAVAGDSIAAPKAADARPETGWGMALPFYLSSVLTVDNHARNGRSSKSFVDEGRLATLLGTVGAGDVVLVQFGHNDSKKDDAARYTEPWSTYQEHLARYVAGARERGATPVLATPVERRRFDAAGNATSSHGEYPDAMRALAAELDVPLVDTQRQSLALWQELGRDGTRAYFDITDDHEDNTHLSPRGAGAIARMVVRGLLDTGVLTTDVTRRLDQLPADEWFTYLEDAPA